MAHAEYQLPPLTGLRVEVYPDYHALSEEAAETIAHELRAKPDLLLCTATGSSPTGTYARLAELRGAEPGLFKALRIVKLDEWGGLAIDDPGACEAYLRHHVLEPLGVSRDRYVAFRSDPEDPEGECRRVARLLEQQGPIDVCVLGIGLNGHIALNEPGPTLSPHAHIAELTEQSRRHVMLKQTKTQVRYGLTLGVADILRSRKILLLVSGAAKKDVLARLLAARIATDFPASLLWLHRDVTILCDREAAGE